MEDRGILDRIFEEPLADSSSDEELIDYALRRRRPRYRPRIDHFLYEEEDFRARFRMSRELVQALAEMLEPRLRRNTKRSHAVTTEQQLLLTLQFYATGTFQRCVGDMSGLHKSTVCRVIHAVSHELALIRPEYIYMPNCRRDIDKTVDDFFEIHSFPKVLGAIDCTHIPIQSPGGDNAEYYRNRKQIFSINVQAVSDANLCIRNIVARWPGSAHDSHIFNSSNLKARMENREFGDTWLLGDQGYALKPYLLTPIAHPQTIAERLYNDSHIHSRNVVERTFGVWKRRFPAIATKLRVNIERVQAIIVATAVLHNICREAQEAEPPDLDLPFEDNNARDSDSDEDENNAHQPPMPIDAINRQTLINDYFARM